MKSSLVRVTNVALRRGTVIGRRDFLKHAAAVATATTAASWTDAIAVSADDLRSRGMACILLWMFGGPSQFETFSPAQDPDVRGPTRPIGTNVAGIEISEHLPRCAAAMSDLAVIRSMTSKEGNHQRASYLLHHGYLPASGVSYPAFGANVAEQIGDQANQLPNFVQIGRMLGQAGDGGFLGVEFDPLVLKTVTKPPRNTTPLVPGDRYARRMSLLDSIQRGLAYAGGAKLVADHRRVVERAAQMIHSPKMEAFDLAREPASVREAYGAGEFAAGCLMARRLIESGVTFVEVSLGGWDAHEDNFAKTRARCGEIDQPFSQLLSDLKERGMLKRTLVIWMGEFGRTPQINLRGGRDHFPRVFNVVLAGAGVQGGQVIGRTNSAGSEIVERPVTVADLFHSVYFALGIDPEHENLSTGGRPIRLADEGTVVQELFA